ncbi:UNVERIFIED_CONTAM: hypothetical protein FKN15_034044 [Acipenser sinensis]
MKQRFESTEQVNNLREIQAMRRLSPHPNILQLHEVLHDRKTGSLSLICELMEMNVYELIRGRRDPLPENKIKSYMYQLCKSLDHMHRNGIFHRDVKPENILIRRDVLKLADFGSCRSVYSKPPYTEYISTRWYRAPECLLTDGHYSYKMDMWSAGCVFFEIVRVAEKQAATLRRAIGAVQQGENSGTPNSIDNLWRIARQGRRPHHIKHVQEPLVRRHGPPYPLELPKLNVAAPKIPTYPMTSLTSVLSQNVTLPVLQPTKSSGKTNKPSKEHPLKPCLKTYHIPPLERKGEDL